jgi:hypothetical protein
MLFFTVVTSYALKDVYLKVYLSVLNLVALHSPIAAGWDIMCYLRTSIRCPCNVTTCCYVC